MSTTIDTIQVEIQTSSTNAAVGIRDLSAALAELKKNGTIGVATKNLKALSDALAGFRDASRATTSLGKLSGAIERLKSIGSVSGVANSIKKLSDNLRTIDNINIDSVAPQIERVASALAPLSAVKSGGINTMMLGLKKLGEVTKSLDDDTIAAFTQKVQKLNEVLAPLSEKMTTLQGGFKGINSAIKQTTVSVQQANTELNVNVFNLSNMINVIQGVIQALDVVVQKLQEAIGMAIEWDGIAARFGRGFGAQAEETYAWIQRLNEEMGINIQQFMQYSSVYATMLTGFGVAMEDAGKMALGYTELTYDIWAGYNDVYKNFADAAEAVKSAIAGEVEPIRRAGFTIVESTLEQTAANHGLSISIEKATEAQKSYLRYLTLVDQANSQGLVGTYAKELQTAEGLVRTLTQQMNSLKQAFGSLFLPILIQVIPWLQAFVDLLTEAVHWVAALFGVELQKVDWSGYGEGSGAIENIENSANGATGALDEATKAAKELKNATLGIDELNVISPNSGSNGAGGAGGGAGAGAGGAGFDGLDIDSLWDESIFDQVQSQVDEIKEKIKDMLPTIAGVAAGLAGLRIASLLDDLDLADGKFAKFETKIKGLSKGLSVASIAIAVGTIVWDLTGAYLESGEWLDWLTSLGTTAIGAGLAYKFGGKGGAGFTLMVSGAAMLGRLVFDLSEGTVDFGDSQTWVTMLTGGIETILGGVLTWKVLGPKILPLVKKVFGPGAMASIGTTVGSAFTGGWTAITGALASIPVWGWIAAAVVALIGLSFVEYDFTEVGRTLGEKVGQAIRWTFENLTPIGLSVKFGKWLMKEIDVDTVWGLIKSLFSVETWTGKIFPAIGNVFTEITDWIGEKVENLKGNINEFFSGFFGGLFDGLEIDMTWAERLAEFFEMDYVDLIETIINPRALGEHIMIGINKGIDSSAKLSAIRDKLSNMWADAKTWWDENKGALKEYTPSIGSIKDKLSSAWSSAKTWWDKNRGSLATYTPSIGKIWEKLKSAWTSAKDWWNKSRSNLSYTPSIGSIASKLSSAWTTAKNWWNKSRSSLSYTPSIGSIKDKLVSAWNSAKSWWSSTSKSLTAKLNIQTPKLTINWGEVTALGKTFKYPKSFSLKFAAAGGVFDQGSLVWAGERGPEILANANGGRTGVMNVQQMQDAVYEGVYAAVIAAMVAVGGNGGSQPVNVYLDGRQITATVERRQRERGASIMGNQVYSY